MRFPTYFPMALASIFNFFMPVSMMINPECDYYQDVILGQQYYIYNKHYPNSYPASTSCRWVARSEPGTKIVISCEDITIPSSTGCTGDRLSISLSGDDKFADSKNYCGSGSVSLVTDRNALAVGLFSTSNSKGGKFICTLTAIQDTSSDATTPAPSGVCDCGLRYKPRIVGGEETGVNEYPEMAGIIDVKQRRVYCGGTIISDRYILTAAHCLSSRTIEGIGVLVGDHDVNTGSDTPSSALYRVSAFYIHPDFVQSTLANDIALIQTATIMVFSIRVGPVCLPFRYSNVDFTGQVVTALGWGLLFFSGPQPDALQKVNLTIVSTDRCAAENSDLVTYTNICTYAEGKDACQSDSGGPLLWTDPSTNRLQLIGIISSGLGCATTVPGINTRVTPYLSWIVSRTSDAKYCIR